MGKNTKLSVHSRVMTLNNGYLQQNHAGFISAN